MINRFVFLVALLLTLGEGMPAVASATTNSPTIIVIVGAAGEDEFAESFREQAQAWERVCQQAGANTVTIGVSTTNQAGDLESLKQQLALVPTNSFLPLWLVMIGHGTFDGKEARFNLRGPDLSATQLAEWVKPFHRPLVIINAASCSAPFLNKLSSSNRVVITATRSGSEQNFTRLGQYFSEAIASLKSDLDGDGQTSLLEAFLSASSRVAEFYKTEGRLATEHPLIDDNGDSLGTPPDWFRGVRAVKKAQQGSPDGLRAHQIHLVLSEAESSLTPETRAKRDALELEMIKLREKKQTMPEEDYYRKLEALLLELARLQVVGEVER